MLNITGYNAAIHGEIEMIASVAGYLWQKNWAECNGGNISVNITSLTGAVIAELPNTEFSVRLKVAHPRLAGHLFYVTGAGQRMRDVAASPLQFGSVIRISADGGSYGFIPGNGVTPTSELPSHLAIQDYFLATGSENRAVLHTHPTELIALTHCKPLLDAAKLTRLLWSMIPETRIIVPKGVGIVPYVLTGTDALATATLEQLEHHDLILWEKHGILATGPDIVRCFDAIDTLSKSASIYLSARMAGFEPDGLSNAQLDELAIAFNLPR